MTIENMKKKYYEFLDILDPTGTNTKFYKEMFTKMSDREFKTWVKEGHFQLYVNTGEVEPNKKIAFEACDYVGIKPFEKLAMPHIYKYEDGTPMITEKEVLIVRIHLRRLHQTVSTENAASSEIILRDKTNQVYGEDKSAQLSADEVSALLGSGYDKVITELLTIRADHSISKKEAYSNLMKTGTTSIPQSINDPKSKIALNYIDSLFLAAGISTNLIEPLEFR